jgi:hypothetical protein
MNVNIPFQGTVKQLQDMTGWRGEKVLYFGDHPYSDLADVTLEHGWRTGAIINELSVSCSIYHSVLRNNTDQASAGVLFALNL